MTDIPQKPSEPSYTEMAQRAREEAAKPPGAFWSVLGGLLSVCLVLFAYGLIWVSPLFKYIPAWAFPKKKN